MGTLNPCSICGKEMKKNVGLLVPCQTLDVHGKSCDCALPVGRVCFKRLEKKKGRVGAILQ